MSFAGALKTAGEDLVELAIPVVARFGASGRTVAVGEGDGLALYEVSPAGAVKPLQKAPKTKGGPVELRLPASSVLSRTLTLPAAGRDYVEPILDHRLEKLVPWAPDRVLYGYHVTGETPSGELEVDFAAASRDFADRWVAKAEAAGLTPTAIGSAAEPLERPLALDLWRGKSDPIGQRARAFVRTAAIVAGAVLVPLVGLSFYALHAADTRAADIEVRSSAARRALAEAIGAGAGSREAGLIASKKPENAAVVLLDRLSRTIPQDTVLRDLEVAEGRVRLAGSSAAAPALIGTLEASGVVRGARFAAPVTRTPDGRDAFEILAARDVPPVQPQTGAAPAQPTEQLP